MTGSEGSSFILPPLLLGGVLKGDISAASEVSGTKFARVVSTEWDLVSIFGFPARLTGGGTGGADDTGRSPLRGSLEGPLLVLAEKRGFTSRVGVELVELGELRLGILKNLERLDTTAEGDGSSSAACETGREGCGESIGDAEDLGGDRGDCTVTLGGD